MLLQHLQTYHLYSIPYENVDVAVDKDISPSIPAIYENFIVCKRGGNRFELFMTSLLSLPIQHIPKKHWQQLLMRYFLISIP